VCLYYVSLSLSLSLQFVCVLMLFLLSSRLNLAYGVGEGTSLGVCVFTTYIYTHVSFVVVCCSVLHSVAVFCNMLQCVAYIYIYMYLS